MSQLTALIKSKYDLQEVAVLLGFNNTKTLYDRLCGRVDWRYPEVLRLMNLLDLPIESICDYFGTLDDVPPPKSRADELATENIQLRQTIKNTVALLTDY